MENVKNALKWKPALGDAFITMAELQIMKYLQVDKSDQKNFNAIKSLAMHYLRQARRLEAQNPRLLWADAAWEVAKAKK